MDKLIIITASLFLIVSCGGEQSSPSTSDTNNSNPVNISPTPSNPSATNLITSFLSTSYDVEILLLNSDMNTNDQNLSSVGQLGSGNHLTSYQSIFNNHAGQFIATLDNYILTVVGTHTVDSTEVTSLINQYKAFWITRMNNDMNTHFSGFPTNAVNSISSALTTSTNNAFQLLILNLQAKGIL